MASVLQYGDVGEPAGMSSHDCGRYVMMMRVPRLVFIISDLATCAQENPSSTIMSVNTPAQQNPTQPSHALDERCYYLTDEERTFFKQQTGIQDDEELKAHILEVQAEAYKVHPYPCIRHFEFAM